MVDRWPAPTDPDLAAREARRAANRRLDRQSRLIGIALIATLGAVVLYAVFRPETVAGRGRIVDSSPVLPPVSRGLEVRDLDASGKLVRSLALGKSGAFRLTYTHSMYGGYVAESYTVSARGGVWPLRIRDRDVELELRRTTVRTERAGAAEYYAYYGNFRSDGEGWVVDVEPLSLPHLLLRVDRIGSPQLEIDGRTLTLLDQVPDGHLVELRPAYVAGTREGSPPPSGTGLR